MKSVLLASSIAAALIAASPAIACRANTVAPLKPVPPIDQRIVFTAVLESRERDEEFAFEASMRVQQRLLGEAPDLVTVSRAGVRSPSEDPNEVILGRCIRYLPFEWVLASAPLGSEVVVIATPGYSSVEVLDVVLADTDRGRELRALANP